MSGPALYFAMRNGTTLPQTPPQEVLTWGYREPSFVSLTRALAGVPVQTRGERA